MKKKRPSFSDFVRQHAVATGVLVVALFVGVGLLTHFLEDFVLRVTEQTADFFGFWGLAFLLFVSDTIISPVPPDLILMIVAKSVWSDSWPFYVTILALISTLAGQFGWLIGRLLAKQPMAPQALKDLARQQKPTVRRFGLWAVILGCLTPLPYSVTCWTAGFLNLNYKTFFLASLLRIPRIIIFYLIIAQSSRIWLLLP